ncbi:MAG: Pili biogenesis protein ATPase [Candidatus Giovannonibacteria bacterium GW2011_GWB1_46_20]|nr:MAG: Pili biogenesis protein ATPase [Candidatus Giovannonibacteria bacterium GW2011_GWB1_46_20]
MQNTKKELDNLISIVVKEGASDLHLSANRYPAIRVTGNLIPLVNELMGDDNFKKFVDTKEADFSYEVEKMVRFRGNAFFQKGAVGVALRVIPSNIKTINELNLPPILESFTRKKQGFFLVVGPVGQGKSTTLASMINLINRERAEHIITIEDPIEYLFKEDRSIIDQREVYE